MPSKIQTPLANDVVGVVLIDPTTGNSYSASSGGGTASTVSIDQTTIGTTDSVTVKASAGIGSLTETAPITDIASSGLNGRLQRIAQRLSTLITALGSPFQAGGSIGNTSFGATQSGTWTVQPGNTANTTAWKVDGSAVTQPVSLASVPSHNVTNAGTFAVQAAATLAPETTKVIGTVNIASAQTLAALTSITNALPSGTNLLGKVSIDQTTPGTTNKVSLGADIIHTIVDSDRALAIYSDTFTREANTTPAYDIGDVINNSATAPTLLTFSNVLPNNGDSGTIVKAIIDTNNMAWVGMVRLYLFNATVTPINDKAQFADLAANRAKKIGYIDFPQMESVGTSSDIRSAQWTEQLPFKCDAAANDLYGVLVAMDSDTPASGQVFTISLGIK